MWIRSQDKEILIKVDGLRIEKNKIVIETSDWYIVLGEYSTNEKAIKVLNMIQEYIEDLGAITARNVFIMPQNNEVE